MILTSYPVLLAMFAAVFAHASFQLGVSMLTLLSSHAIGKGKRHSQVLRLDLGYSLGAFLMTAALLALFVYTANSLLTFLSPLHWALMSGVLVGAGLAVILFYYRRGKGTMLWLPRGFVEFASARAKKTRNAYEAFAIGATMVIAELPFLFAPLALISLILHSVPSEQHLITLLSYSFLACLPLLVITFLISSGHKISTIQRWRESNKVFLQWTSGLLLILLGVYTYGLTVWGYTS